MTQEKRVSKKVAARTLLAVGPGGLKGSLADRLATIRTPEGDGT